MGWITDWFCECATVSAEMVDKKDAVEWLPEGGLSIKIASGYVKYQIKNPAISGRVIKWWVNF